MTQTIATLGEFLQAGQADYQIYDLGRRLTCIDNQQFDAIERQQQPYPFPIRHQAQLAVIFHHRQQPSNDFLWFLQFPLDERGLLSTAARDHYLEFVLGALGHELTGELSEQQQQQLQQNPYLFTPNETQRAALHARIRVQYRQHPSQYFDQAVTYLQHQQTDWQQLGLQGIHDCAARLNNLPELAAAVAQGFEHYPGQLRQPLAVALEQQTVPARLRDQLLILLDSGVAELRRDALRALASHADNGRLQRWLKQQLTEQTLDADCATIIAARLWPALQDQEMIVLYLDLISQLPEPLFDALFGDIIALPTIRPLLLSLIAQGQLSNNSLAALNRLRGQITG
ncbi:DUF3549 family protein [Idiomarina seosinensis]|uniref:DUF3549 family protein n=1 Tax=Idiomarina seosinensis TaxID=281739 RepID=UPI00384CD9F3